MNNLSRALITIRELDEDDTAVERHAVCQAEQSLDRFETALQDRRITVAEALQTLHDFRVIISLNRDSYDRNRERNGMWCAVAGGRAFEEAA